MDLMPDDIRARLLANAATREADHVPVVKYFDAGAATWIITELMQADGQGEEPDFLFGLCDLGMGEPELGYVRFSELASVMGRLGLGIERDLHFRPRYPISVYAHAAHRHGRIVESAMLLDQSAALLGIPPVADPEGPLPPPAATN